MMIKIILIILVLMMSMWFMLNRSKSNARAGVKVLVLLLMFGAIIVILFPNTSNTVAKWVGVGRGADLLLYILAASFLFFVLSYYVRAKDNQLQLAKLARKIAIIEANESKHNLKIKKR